MHWDDVIVDARSEVQTTSVATANLIARNQGGQILGRLETRVCALRDFREHPIVRSNFELDSTRLEGMDSRDPIVLVGSLVREQGGAVLSELGESPDTLDATVRALVLAALLRAPTDIPVIAVNVPDAQFAAFEGASEGTLSRLHTHRWHELHLDGRLTLEQQLDSWNAKTRRTWKKDLELVDTGDFDIAVEEVSAQLLRDLSALITLVRRRNGMDSHPVAVEFEVETWRAAADHENVFAFTCRSKTDGALLAGTLACTIGQRLMIRDVGLADEVPSRSLLYRAAVFVAPLRYALDGGYTLITLGFGHDEPKRSRGALSTPMHTIMIW